MWNRNLITGTFVLVGIALFTVVIFLIGGQHGVFASNTDYYVEFSNISGLTKGSKVRVGGLDAGEVMEIGIPDSPGGRFRLKLRVGEQVHRLIRSDSVVRIVPEGLVGEKLVLIYPGTAKTAEAKPGDTLQSKEAVDLMDISDNGANVLDYTSETIKPFSEKLIKTLDATTMALNNANGLLVNIRQGKGTVGMLFEDETTAANIRESIANVRETTASAADASKRADALLADVQSRQLGEKVDRVMDSVQSTAVHLNATSQKVEESLAKALGPDNQGVDAASNIRNSLSNLNQATGNMSADTEALKHHFLFRGYFKHRGYYSLANLNPETYRKDKLFSNPANTRIWLDKEGLFEQKQDGTLALSSAGKAKVDASVAQIGDAALSEPLIVEGYAVTGEPGVQLAKSSARAIAVGQYLQARFYIDPQNLGTVSLRATPPRTATKASWDGVCIVLLRRSSK
jgi:phospholipid/cholesterol/gamma-HCH transport system substrate-binding protein